MTPQRGYYSIVQFCPNAARLEAVNIGVILFCPESGFLSARMTDSSERAKRFFRRDRVDLTELEFDMQAFEERLKNDREVFRTVEDMQQFIDTRSNSLILSASRPMKVFDPKNDLEKLFSDLVGTKPKRQRSQFILPELDTFFVGLEEKGRAKRNVPVVVPVIRQKFSAPYAYQNGVLNLVKPQRFKPQEPKSLEAAERLAIQGDLIQRHGVDSAEARLVVVASFDTAGKADDLENRVGELFKEYHVELIEPSHLTQFIARVEREAHC